MSAETFREVAGGGIGTVYGVLLNDADAVTRLSPAFHDAPYRAPPIAPILYIKPRNTFARDGHAVAVPPSPGEVQIDATVGAVIGRTATGLDEADALSFVAGFVIVSDVTLPHDSFYRPAVRQRCRDGFCPIGDRVEGAGFDLAAAEVVVRINDVTVHRRALSRLVRPLPRLLRDITAFMTLEAGDVVLVGPPDAAPIARPGDRVRIDVAGLGSLSHLIVLEAAS